MAKRTNIERIIKAEIEKGNVYVIPGGNFVNEEMLEKEIKDDFKKAISEPDFDMNITLATYKENKLASMRKAEDLLAHIETFFQTAEPTPDKQKKGVDA